MKKVVFLNILIITLFSSCQNQYNDPTLNNKTKTSTNSLLVYSSSSNDLEDEVKILETNNEMTYHYFDFKNMSIKMETQSKDGKWKSWDFKITDIRELDNGIIEFVMDNKACNQVWISGLSNIGYEFNNGQKMVFYNIKQTQ